MWIGGDVLAPGPPEREIQIIDVRDLAQWIVRMIERRLDGAFNATGPQAPLRFGSFLETCGALSQAKVSMHWASPSFLKAAGVAPWTEMPMWLPPEEGDSWDTISSRKAQQHGLSFRVLTETVQDTLEWDRQRALAPLVCGISPARERDLLSELLSGAN